MAKGQKMTEIKGVLDSLVISLDNNQVISFKVSTDVKSFYEQNKGEELDISIKKHREKRSLNANALCWKLCTQIGNILRCSKDEVYISMLKSYGQSELVSVRSDINIKRAFKYFDEAGQSTLNDTVFTHYRVYIGSSEYDTKEMSILIDGIVSEAKALGITVMSERELSLIKDDWRENSAG